VNAAPGRGERRKRIVIDHPSISVTDSAFVLDPGGDNVEAVCHQAP